MTRQRTIVDFFCGAGGSSTGLVSIPGVEVICAANHDQTSLDTHAANHPKTRHFWGDLRITSPQEFEPTEAAWFSPECTKHSLARGVKRKGTGWRSLWGDDDVNEDDERSRATMREVIEFTAYHKYKLVIVENVTEIRYWPHYLDWLKAMRDMGYEHKEVFLNSMHVGVPQSRDRIYVCFWLKGNRKPDLDIRPRSYCAHCEKDVGGVWARKNRNTPLPGKVQYGKQYVYVCPNCAKRVEPYIQPAAMVIDWWRQATRIADRKKPLSPNTMRRIQRGLEKYAGQYFVMDTAHSSQVSDNSHVRLTSQPLPTLTTAQSLGLAMPFMIDNKWHDKETSANLISVEGTMPTIMTVNTFSLVQPEPFIIDQYGRDSAHNPVSEPLSTVTTINHSKSLIIPPAFIAPYYGVDDWSDIRDPLPAITTKNHHGLVENPVPDINECLYRMLHVEELKRGMSFPQEYIILGTSDEVKNKQIGNAVTPYVATELGGRMFDSLEVA